MRRLERMPKPVIAMINGFALGGGLELAMACHLRIAADSAKLGQPEINLGLIPGFGGTQRLLRLAGRAATLELCLQGAPIDAARAHALGIVNRVVPAADLEAETMKLARAAGPGRAAGAARHPRLRRRRRRMRHRGRPRIRDHAVRADLFHRRHARGHERLPRAPQARLRRNVSTTCPYCGSTTSAIAQPRALLAAIASDDLDAAIELGLLQFELRPGAPCADCGPDIARLLAARDARRSALAARERYRRRDARLAQRAEANAARRKAGAAATADMPKPALARRRGCSTGPRESQGRTAHMTAGRMTARPRRGRRMTTAEISEMFARWSELDPHPTTELAYTTPFELLVAVILSAQATDVGVNKATRRLFPVANTPAADGRARRRRPQALHRHDRPVQRQGGERGGDVAACCSSGTAARCRATRAALEALPGVGRKTANVVLNTAFGEPTIAVDTHIFRVSNRTGLAPGKDVRAVEDGAAQARTGAVPARTRTTG